MELLVAVLATLAFMTCALVGLALHTGRVVSRRVAGVRDRARLAARSYAGGTAGVVARLRRDLERAVTGARKALAVARAIDAPVGDVPSLLARLELGAHGVDGELQLLETQPDPARVAAGLDGPRGRARALTEAAGRLVDGLLDAAGSAAVDVPLLQAECAIESEALRARQPPPHSPRRFDHVR
jgi:hypothetical protein